ncbi:hypothetical protein ACX0HA_02635 [Flavobacterium hauense]
MKRLIFIIYLLAMVACKKEPKHERSVFYTFEALREHLKKQPNPDNIPLPIALHEYYSIHNFIVDSIGNLYYFQHDIPLLPGCGTGYDEDSYPAKFINLKPEELIKISSSEIELFIKSKVLNDTVYGNQKILFIGSEKDTFQSPDFSKVIGILDNDDRTLLLRRITQEESEVLNHKKKKIPYDYHLIKWHSARTTFKKHY